MVIRTREEALKALWEILSLERGRQLMQLTEKLGECVTPQARQVLLNAQEGITTGKLTLALSRKSAAAPAAPPGEDPLGQDVATALEAMTVAESAYAAFPGLRSKTARWELARAVIHAGEDVRRLIAEGKKGRSDAETALAALTARLRPWWHTQIPAIARACEEVRREAPESPWRVGARALLDIVAATELRSMYSGEDTAGTVAAMMAPLRSVYASLQSLAKRVYPKGLPPDSALAL